MNVAPSSASMRLLPLWALALAATVTAYHTCFYAPFLFDDGPSIVDNASIRRLSHLGEVLAPSLAGGETVSGRPLVNLSFALNYAASGTRVWSYHAVNLGIHLCAGLALFGVVRRSLSHRATQLRTDARAARVAISAACWWLVHPLQTEAVTYIAQRAEALMALFYLLTLYGFIRATQSPRYCGWLTLSWLSCLLGMATKEVMVSAPLVVFFYDRTFVAGAFATAWTRRRGYYLALGGTWMLLALLVLTNHGRGGTAGFATDITPWQYLLTQLYAVPHYFRLAVWPQPLVFDYGTRVVGSLWENCGPTFVLLALIAVLWKYRRSKIGFLGFCVFAVLAPSSTVVPIASQTMAEHRMYLPMAAILTGLVLLLERWLGPRFLFPIASAVSLALAGTTLARNGVYGSELNLWADTAEKQPDNARAQHNLGLAKFHLGAIAEAQAKFEQAARLQPRAAEPHYNLGLCLARLQRYPEAIEEYERALRLEPRYAEAQNNLGNALLALDRIADARARYEEAIRLKPAFAEAHSNLSAVLLQSGDAERALREAVESLRLQPAQAAAAYNAGNACVDLRRLPEAATYYAHALQFAPDDARAHNNLGNVSLELDRPLDALEHYRRAAALDPQLLDAQRNLGLLLFHLGRLSEAQPYLEVLAGARSADVDVQQALQQTRANARR